MNKGAIQHTLLLVEDEEDLRDGQQALAQLSRIQQLCLVVIDLLMPGMNGWELFEELRRRSELDHVPVVVYSSVALRAPAGASRVLQKPLTFVELLSTVREYCAA
ncbi:MAG TPA: response regulator [Polyangiaceae bacterium]|nr:response regulator [Polyangiaceae bacterium]